MSNTFHFCLLLHDAVLPFFKSFSNFLFYIYRELKRFSIVINPFEGCIVPFVFTNE